MTVYIELVILDNFIMTYAIGSMAIMQVGRKLPKLRLALVSLLGTAISIVYPFLPLTDIWLVVFKICIGCLLGFLLFAGMYNTLKGILIFYIMTALAGGICIMINYLIIGNFTVSLTAAPVMPYSATTMIVLFGYFIANKLWKSTKKRRLRAVYNYKVRCKILGSVYKLNGFLDTGNTLYDSVTDLPIVVVRLQALDKLDYNIYMQLLLGRGDSVSGVRSMRAMALGGESELYLIKPQQFSLYLGSKLNIHNKVMIGIAIKNFGGDADILLHSALLKGDM